MKQKLEAEAILQKLAELRKQLPGIEDMPRSHGASDGRLMLPDDIPAETEEDFEWAAVIDGLHAFAADVSAVKERARARAIEAALQIYYTAEQLARDPANAELLPHVQSMREAYEREFGKPIPPREGKGE